MPSLIQFQSTGGVESHPALDQKVDEPSIKRSTSIIALHYWCYALHAVLFILQVTLLAMLWNHPEHNITIAFDNSALTIGLSAFLQAFYTLYTAFLVFLTQRLALTQLLSRPRKLTTIHDVSGAWDGLGAAATALWQQTSVAVSTGITFLIFVYLFCISVLHVASPTIIQFEPYTAITVMDIPANSTWPSASTDLSSLDMSTAASLLRFLSILGGLSTDGLSNSTLYDTFNETPQMINASVKTHTIRANCGLLQNLSYVVEEVGVSVTAWANSVTEVSWVADPGELVSDGLWYTGGATMNNTMVYVVSTAMEINNTVSKNTSLDIVLDPATNGSKSDNISTTVYMIACSLDVSNYTSNLEVQGGGLEPTVDQPDVLSQPWSLWTPNEDALGTQLVSMISSSYYSLGNCYYYCGNNDTFDLHLMTTLGIGQPNSAGSNMTSYALMPYQFENALSQMIAQVIWIAGQLSEDDGGFALTGSLAQVTEQLPRWRLNINAIPVIFTLSMSFILTLMAFFILGIPSSTKEDLPSVKGTTVLEMLWVGAHFGALRKRLNMIYCPSSKELRPAGMFQVGVTTSALVREGGTISDEISPLIPEPGAGREFENAAHGWTRMDEDRQHARWLVHALSLLKSRCLWCYLLHGLFLLLHVMLLLLLIHHPEHSIVIQSVSGASTTALAASLQFFYVVYTLILVFLTQRLAVSRAVAHPQNLTSVHDLSQAWTGIGSALVGVWQQVKMTSSLRATLTITTYYLCVSVLHIISTTVIQFEVFDGSTNHIAQSALAWPASGLGEYDWTSLSPIVPLDQLPIFPTKGWAGDTVYDVPTADSTSVNATVNATTVHANCGLLTAVLTDYPGDINTTVPTLGPVVISLPDIWKDTVLFLGNETLYNGTNKTLKCSTCSNYLIYWVTTALEVDVSLGETVNMSTTWLYAPQGQNGTQTSSTTTGCLVACSLNVTTATGVLDIQHDMLTSTAVGQSADAPQQTWSLWSPTGDMPSLSSGVASALNYANPISNSSQYEIFGATFTIMDMYTMSLLGINLTANNAASVTQSSADPSVTLTPTQFEDAVSKIAAQYVWAAGHTNGNFGPTFGSGESVVTDVVTLRRLNVNTVPVVIASTASLVLFVLAVYMVGLGPSTRSPLSELGVLETVWLEAHSNVIHARMRQVTDPTLDNLRAAGMFEVCLADEARGVLDDRPGVVLESPANEGDSDSGSSV